MDRTGLLGTFLAVVAGCGGSSPVETGPDAAVLFLAQASPPNAVMEALFQGRVSLDQAGCFRLAVQGVGPTVIWPFASALVREKTGLVVLDGAGAELVRIGENVRMGGGEISDLVALGVLPGPLLTAALNRCPGPYWIVGEVLAPQPRP